MTGRTLQEAMSERNISRYRLSKVSGIPWATLSDICSGKTELERCSAGTVLKLSKALGMTMEETLDLETGLVSETHDVPEDLSYLEIDLPDGLRAAIEEVRRGFEREDPNIDLLLDRRWQNKKLLRAGKHPKGPAKRTREQDEAFAKALAKLLAESTSL